MEEDLLRQVIKKHKNEALSADELQALLEKYRREQAELTRKRLAEKAETDDKLRQKLEERKKKRAVRTFHSHDILKLLSKRL